MHYCTLGYTFMTALADIYIETIQTLEIIILGQSRYDIINSWKIYL